MRMRNRKGREERWKRERKIKGKKHEKKGEGRRGRER